MQMPLTNGITLGEQIKANAAIADVPLIMLTSSSLRDEVQQALKTGFAAYLVKPVKASKLFDTIVTVLSNQPQPNPSKENLPTLRQPQALETKAPMLELALPKLKILMAEDNLVNQKVALKQLKNLGYDADVVGNGQEVLQLLEKVPYDLILMDCQMPVLDGYETAREICRRESSSFLTGRRPVVVAMTANAMKEDRQKCIDAGMDDYVSKPVSKDKLSAVIEHWTSEIFKSKGIMQSESADRITNSNALDLDWEHLHQLSEDNTEFELELLQMFVEDVPTHLQAAEVAIANNDFQQLEREAHHLKGSSANVGATVMRVSAEKLEQMARQKHFEGATNVISDLEEYLNRIQAFLKDSAE
ncbi:MAG: hypothetical protein NVS2B14_19590 [Chamaesiphon sp.]